MPKTNTPAPATNPYGANQYQLDPRQKLCWDLYVDPKSDTFGNAYKSASKAGYAEDSALQITVAPWFLEKTRTLNMLDKAERNLSEMLDLTTVDEEGKVDVGVLRVKADMTKFVAETQGKDKGYSKRVEQTGKDGEPIKLETNHTVSNDEFQSILRGVATRKEDSGS